MELHYNAFISYRHHPDDIRVATEIHRALERFHIPRSLRKQAGIRGDLHLFRDKEELPITSDLNDDIDLALMNSDFLIVICSVHTKESIWVQREIELFLKTHPRNRVLTVLASGEPYDVIPEILLYDDVTDPVTGEVTRKMVEPLSCDWRIPKRKAKLEELPRLAAPLLGCAYDELKQRQRQYRTRRLIAFFSIALAASLCLTAYFLHTSITIQKANVQIQAQNEEIQSQNEEIRQANMEIQANLDAALKNQSRHLATAAQERLAEGDRLTSIALASAALPSQTNIRPYVAEAEFVLSDALGVYNIQPKMMAVGSVSPGVNASISKFWVTEDADVLYVYDTRHILTAWDTQTLTKLGTIAPQQYIGEHFMTAGSHALILEGTTLSCYQPDGTVLWQMEHCVDMAVADSGHILAIWQNGSDDCQLMTLDPANGCSISSCVLSLPEATEPYQFYGESFDIQQPVAVQFSDLERNQILLMNLADGAYRIIDTKAVAPGLVTIIEGKMLVIEEEVSGHIRGIIEGNRVNSPGTCQIYCYDVSTGDFLWQSQSTFCTVGIHSIDKIPGMDRLLCCNGNVFQVLDMATGETLAQCDASSSILDVQLGELFATAVLKDGFTCNYWYEENYCYETKTLEGDLMQAESRDGYFGLKWYDSQITVYRSLAGSTAWNYAFEQYTSVQNPVAQGNWLLFNDYTDFQLFDMKTQAIAWKLPKDNMTLLGFAPDGNTIWFAKNGNTLVTVDADSGTAAEQSLVPAGDDGKYSVKDSFILRWNTLFYMVNSEQGLVLARMDLNTGKIDLLPLVWEEGLTDCRVLISNGSFIWFRTGSGDLMELNLAAGSLRSIMTDLVSQPALAIRDDGAVLAVSNQTQVSLLTPSGAITAQIPFEEAKAGSLCFYGDQLLVLCDNGVLYRYDIDGNLLSQIELKVGSSFAYDLISGRNPFGVAWDMTQEGHLILNALGYGNVIDPESWTLCAAVPNYLAYLPESSMFICKNPAGGFAGLTQYTTAQLLEIAEEALGGFQLTQEQKASYGID